MIIKFNNFLLEEFKVGNIPISNLDKYLDSMSKGLSDKLFFINQIDLDLLVDFGSADGQVLNHIHKLNPNLKLIGYDIDDDMIEYSRKKYPSIYFTNNWDDVLSKMENYSNKSTGILLSSVIHEVYSYSQSNKIRYFWNNQVFNNMFNYVIIRDMIPSTKFDKMSSIDIKKVKEISKEKYSNYFEDFENHWSDIGSSFRTMLHWLLKYRYTNNWDRELKENYLPITVEHLKNTWIPKSWDIIYEDHYTYSFIKDQIKKDFGIDLIEPTHLKMIIENKKRINESIDEFTNKIISQKDYDKYLLKLKYNYGDINRAKEELDSYLETISDLQVNGGELYRLVFLENIKHLNEDDLGIHWTLYKDDISRFYHNIEVEDEDVKPFLITARFDINSIDIDESISTFVEIPDEQEVNIKKRPISYTIKRYKKR